ncbi:Aste57867_3809 [Aphanomyces stellatus]|uniref:Aste57867_3809 protein n=1 Tax=Aphanomyces stellatus TaxID=120398 RepID=A0A485KEA1_9STRA|nr:hypothetical protein As57867_003798 [Aphanomyces stellatus]VFT80958.1 Aste57867_3809 [Aphanomyces stellatus]
MESRRNTKALGALSKQTALYFPVEYLNTLEVNGFPPHISQLKVGTPIMLLRNLSPAKGMCNGTRLIVTALGRNTLCAAGDHANEDVVIPQIDLYEDENGR